MSVSYTICKPNKMKTYACGPTVYDESHIGHVRTYMSVDIINRIWTNLANKQIYYVMNITDIDDKIIKKALETNSNWIDIAKQYEKSFFNDMSKLNIQLPSKIIRVSEVLPEIIKYIQKIIDNKFAYVTDDLSVYFDTNEYINAGYDFMGNMDDDQEYSTISSEITSQKHNKQDFALWKGRMQPDIGFNAIFTYNGITVSSYGRPGWHIECSTMIHETLGQEVDLHFGGIDLKFPHHYNERLQAHAYYHPRYLNTEPWCPKFFHIGHLCIKGLKMSKSLKNFTTIECALKELNANQLRFMFMAHNLTDSMDFSPDTISRAKGYDATVNNFFNQITNYPIGTLKTIRDREFESYFEKTKSKITSNLIGLNLNIAIHDIFELINKTNVNLNTDMPHIVLIKDIHNWISRLLVILGFQYDKQNYVSISDLMDALVDFRTEVRNLTRSDISKDVKQQLFKILDNQRDQTLPQIGVTLQDTKNSSLWFIK